MTTPPMIGTTPPTKPTHPGWWWYKNAGNSADWEIAKVMYDEAGLLFDDEYGEVSVDDNRIEWGPEIPQYKP